MKSVPYFLGLAICYLIFFGSIFLSFGELPVRLATHFDLHGQPNGWMDREGFIGFVTGFGILVPAFIVGVMATTGFVPVSFVRLPNRDYWLAPERRSATTAILLRFALVLAGMLVLFLTGVYGLTIQANSAAAGVHLDGMEIASLAAVLIFATSIWAAALKRRFARPSGA